MDDLVTVYSPLAFGNDNLQNYAEEENTLKKLASNTISQTLNTDWNVWDTKSFKRLHNDSECAIFRYNLPPPKLKLSSQDAPQTSTEHYEEKKKKKKTSKVSWCMSALPIGENSEAANSSSCSMVMSPTDNSRHKTKLFLNEPSIAWNDVWKKLCFSLQHGKLPGCNAYRRECEEIVIYHNGFQQAEIGQWVWKNIRYDYSKNTMILLDNQH